MAQVIACVLRQGERTKVIVSAEEAVHLKGASMGRSQSPQGTVCMTGLLGSTSLKVLLPPSITTG